MTPKRATRSTPVTENPTTTTVTNAQLQAMIDQGVTAALAAHDANRNGDDSHTSRTGARRTERVARECTYQDFMKCQPLYFKGTESSDDDNDDDDVEKDEEDEEEEEHLALADPSAVPTDDPVPSS
ncbi:hypothetical protein Tco_0508703 [Tanacetum coccineum]